MLPHFLRRCPVPKGAGALRPYPYLATPSGVRSQSTDAWVPPEMIEPRQQRLPGVSRPFAGVAQKSSEHWTSAVPRNAWRGLDLLGASAQDDYATAQENCRDILEEIDHLRSNIGPSKLPNLIRDHVPAYAHQSVQLEGTSLGLQDDLDIEKFRELPSFDEASLPTLSGEELSNMTMPDVSPLVRDSDLARAAELRNNMIASRWIAEVALHNPDTPGFSEKDIQHLSAVVTKDTDPQNPSGASTKGAGPGGYRVVPVSAAGSSPLYYMLPHHQEVPELVRRLFEWRDRAHKEKRLHPLVLACQAAVSFSGIHPFPDFNGQVSRMVMLDYMIRQVYLPAVVEGVDPRDYWDMVADAQSGCPEPFVARVLMAQLDTLYRLLQKKP